jgi:TruD family tRNA pseudouridine synthase
MEKQTHDERQVTQDAFIKKVVDSSPQALTNPTLVEDATFLRSFGIYIPNKKTFPQGVIKLTPEDFIVEEIALDGLIRDVSRGVTSLDRIGPTPFIHATLVKYGMSTIDAIDDLSHSLGCQKTDIGYAGMKDKEAVTAQRISIRGVSLEKIRALHSSFYFLKDFSAEKEPIRKGLLKGNRFTIHIRTDNSFFSADEIKHFMERLKTIQKNGFWNFYYLQRFGMPRLMNVHGGLAIMNGDYERAVRDTITKSSPYENKLLSTMREEIDSAWGNWHECIRIASDLPVLMREEIAMLRFLERNPSHWIGALQQVLDKVSLMVYSVPSLFFNEYISSALERGTEPPREIPLLLSDDTAHIDMYRPMLKSVGMSHFDGKHLRPFSIIKFMKRLVPSRDIPEIDQATPTDCGVAISFSLEKGQYATTFLAHLFNLVSGETPVFVNKQIIDTKSVLNTGSITETLEYFNKAIESRRQAGSRGGTE